MMRHWREREFERHLSPSGQRRNLGLWAFLAKRPWLYQRATRLAAGLLARMGGEKGRLSSLPLAGGWTGHRDLPAPQGETFQALWAKHQKGRRRKGAGR